ncbi:demethoxyubiquinone hydroxylase family protein [Alphaproteobacteria bacterium]|nr:demethoxyubiquinone hydroxylase family protein [Alphaproteobacteria bacterium]
MENFELIEKYNASDISIPKNMVGWMRSNHAGETGAVWIYLGAKCIFWNKKIKLMSKEHYQTEKNHLIIMNHLLSHKSKSKLLILWRILGFSLGFISALLGYRFFCVTIQSVESFVEQHYREQIEFLYKKSISFELLKVLEMCCDEEVEHQNDAKMQKGLDKNSFFENMWSNLIGSGSNVAVNVSKLI